MDRTSPAYCLWTEEWEETILADIKIYSYNIKPVWYWPLNKTLDQRIKWESEDYKSGINRKIIRYLKIKLGQLLDTGI